MVFPVTLTPGQTRTFEGGIKVSNIYMLQAALLKPDPG